MHPNNQTKTVKQAKWQTSTNQHTKQMLAIFFSLENMNMISWQMTNYCTKKSFFFLSFADEKSNNNNEQHLTTEQNWRFIRALYNATINTQFFFRSFHLHFISVSSFPVNGKSFDLILIRSAEQKQIINTEKLTNNEREKCKFYDAIRIRTGFVATINLRELKSFIRKWFWSFGTCNRVQYTAFWCAVIRNAHSFTWTECFNNHKINRKMHIN